MTGRRVRVCAVISLPVLAAPDCRTFPCREECCSAGVDVWVDERQRMLDDGIASSDDFTGPEDDDGDVLYRTALGPRGCVFLQPERGCRLHAIGYKPRVCGEVPRDAEEVEELVGYAMLPCHAAWSFAPRPSDGE
jgi:Fe-S-cluster containining protein